MGAVLRSRPYLLLWTSTFASMMAGFFNYVAVAWLALQLTGSNLVVGTVLAAASIPQAVFLIFGGAVTDRFSPRNTMVSAGVIRAAVTGLLAALTLTHSVQLWQIFGAAILVGTTSSFFVPASLAMVPRVVGDNQLEAGNALMNLSRTAAMVLGSAAAGVVVAAAGAGTALAVDAAASPARAVPAPAAATTTPAAADPSTMATVRLRFIRALPASS